MKVVGKYRLWHAPIKLKKFEFKIYEQFRVWYVKYITIHHNFISSSKTISLMTSFYKIIDSNMRSLKIIIKNKTIRLQNYPKINYTTMNHLQLQGQDLAAEHLHFHINIHYN